MSRGKNSPLNSNIFWEAHHCCALMSQTATSQTCRRNILTKDTLVPSWILEHHFLHFPANDSIFTSLASHSTQLSFLKHVPSSYRDGLFGSVQILPWNLPICVVMCEWGCVMGLTSKNAYIYHTHTHKLHGRGRELVVRNNNVTDFAWGGWRQFRGTQGSIEDSLSLVIPESSPFFFRLCCRHSCSRV